MLDDESRIRTLIEGWARAAQAGDIEGVLVDHSADIVMFDVPPPEDGARGIEAYRQTWPSFFKAQEKDGIFEIVSLDVTAGADVAFAYALLRCGAQEELTKHPDKRLRLTMGLRKQKGRWLITHEHHSFTLAPE